jgi:group I intron endonuclease
MTYIIYEIKNTVNGKRYVGRTSRYRARTSRHKSDLRNNTHHNSSLQRDWGEFGEPAFTFSILSEVENLEDAVFAEQSLLDSGRGKDLYNIGPSTCGDNLTFNPDRDDIVSRITDAINERYESMSPEDRKVIHGSHINGMTGRTHSDEVKSAARERALGNSWAKGHKRTPEQREKLSKVASERTGDKNSFYGKKHTEETKRALSIARLGVLPPNTKAVVIEGTVYPSRTAAAKYYGIAVATVGNRIASKSDKWSKWSDLDS